MINTSCVILCHFDWIYVKYMIRYLYNNSNIMQYVCRIDEVPHTNECVVKNKTMRNKISKRGKKSTSVHHILLLIQELYENVKIFRLP